MQIQSSIQTIAVIPTACRLLPCSLKNSSVVQEKETATAPFNIAKNHLGYIRTRLSHPWAKTLGFKSFLCQDIEIQISLRLLILVSLA